ncbi:preprotein translocase SecF subunit [Scopulibacillus darangshiensis]|uniref:Protein-export membrane protein SecF n=1 Tax=Scopulibacillus darangshiensis TaxID=442528 RepID=A0A4V6NQR7_9BACL|nr:preprotein translocase SecF subunit [Scopulibacillus darangshiensis]
MIFKNFDFVKHRNKFFIFSSVLTVIGIIFLFVFGMNLGIDFSKGTRIDIKGTHALSTEKVDQQVQKLGYKPKETILSGNNKDIVTIRLNEVLDKEQIAEMKTAFKDSVGVDKNNVNISTVSPQVGRDLAKNAFYAVIISSIFIIIYVWIRFEFLQGLTAIIALLHDAFFIITIFSLLQIEVNIVFIAAVLTIVGYSINDTIVTFDRIRENTKLRKKKPKTFEEFSEIANNSIRQTLTRSINTVLTVLLPVIALLIFGSESIRTFTIALFIGLLIGVYSSIFIASPLWAIMKAGHIKRKQKKKAAQPQT